jgi:SAM-dependent methyltransferase
MGDANEPDLGMAIAGAQDRPMVEFHDHFSRLATGYRQYRPTYPAALFHYLASIAPDRHGAWDCATGNGQAAVALAAYFAQVIATDASAGQIARAQPCPGVVYRVASAAASGLPAASMDLITVAQALHWFDLAGFYPEVRRVLRPGGVIAVWTYNRLRITPAIDQVVEHLYTDILGPWWPAERRLVETGYRDLPFPFTEQPPPTFEMRADWTLAQLMGYLHTWSAVGRYRQELGEDPLARLTPALAAAWGKAAVRNLAWPLGLRIGLV